jgi:serine/threonine-protein kinase ATR
MNVAPPPTPFPVPSFNGSNFDASPAQFLEFLRSLISQYLDGDATSHIDASNTQTWTAIVVSLAETFLASFPLPDHVPWNTMQEKVTIVEATLEVMQRVFQRVDGIYYGSDDLVKKLFARLLDLCQVLDLWVERDLSPDEGVFMPQHMKDKTFNIIVMVLRGLGGANLNLKASETTDACWKTLRCILTEGVEMCRGMLKLVNRFCWT